MTKSGSLERLALGQEIRAGFWPGFVARGTSFSRHAWLVLLLLSTGCDRGPVRSGGEAAPAKPETPPATNTAGARLPLYGYEVVNAFPHDRTAFTQGLLFVNGLLLEGTGMKGDSSLREVELETGRVLRKRDLAAEYFGEGLALLGGKLFQLTWQEHKVFVYDAQTFEPKQEFALEGEGWGLTTDGQSLIMSDGTSDLQFIDPATFQVKRKVEVVANGRLVNRLNELEWMKDEILANVWGTDYILRINPATGAVTGAIDLAGLLAPADRTPDAEVLNGIAYDAAGDRLFVTGKRWPKIYEIRLRLKR